MKAGSCSALASVLVLATAAFAAAQQPRRDPPPILPPQPAALSVPDPFAGLRQRQTDLDLYQSLDRSDRFRDLSRRHPGPPLIVYPGVYIPGPYYVPLAGMTSQRPYGAPRIVSARGGLTLETLPDVAQVYIDGFYVGLAGEFGLRGRVLDLSAGAHRVELRAPGYETLSFSVLIAPNDTLRYRGDMQALPSKQTVVIVPSQPPAAKSLYVIPNCYAGDKPPTTALPPGCELKNLRTR